MGISLPKRCAVNLECSFTKQRFIAFDIFPCDDDLAALQLHNFLCYLPTSFLPIVTKFLLLGENVPVYLATKKKNQVGKRENFSTQFRQKRNYFSTVQRNFLFCLPSFSMFFSVFLRFSVFVFSFFLLAAKTSVASLPDLINIKCYRFAQRILHGEGDQF